MQTLTSFNIAETNHLQKKMFFDASVGIARYDKIKYPQIDKLTDKMLSFFWRPEEVDLSKDKIDFSNLSSIEKHIFTSNIKRQIVLDSIQGRAPSTMLLPYVSLPELEPAIQTWAFFETIHSRSYTHIIRNVYSNPSEVFDDILKIQEIRDCAFDCSKYYDEFSENINGDKYKNLALLLASVNALEGLRFYVSFACAWAFAEVKKMEGNAKIVKLIARDENVHLALTTHMIKLFRKESVDFEAAWNIQGGMLIKQIFKGVIDSEKKWATYLFKDGSILGLNEKLLHDYIDWLAAKRLKALGLNISSLETPGSNPLPWTEKWIGGSDVQVAPQETQITSYTIGNIKQDITSGFLKDITL